MFISLQHTQFLGKNLVFLPTCASTNAEAHTYLQENSHVDISHAHHEGTIIITENQTAGRGQRGNVWEAEPNTNLTFSLILSPKFLTVAEQFKLNVAITVGITDMLQNYLPVQIKWSNDIYTQNKNDENKTTQGKKIGGILIENTIQQNFIQHAIIGIGLNINQLNFSTPIATSLINELTNKTKQIYQETLPQIPQQKYDLQTVLEQVVLGIENRYLQLRGGQYNMLKMIYLQRLYWFQEIHTFQAQDKYFVGLIIGIDNYGRLAINTEGTIKYFDVKEVIFIA